MRYSTTTRLILNPNKSVSGLTKEPSSVLTKATWAWLTHSHTTNIDRVLIREVPGSNICPGGKVSQYSLAFFNPQMQMQIYFLQRVVTASIYMLRML